MITIIDSAGKRHEGLELELVMALRGNWTGHAELGDDVALPVGPCSIEIQRDGGTGALDTFAGFVRTSGAWQGRSEAQLVGGAGGNLTAPLKPKHYATMTAPLPALTVAQGIVAAAGEALDAGAAATLGALTLPQWTVTATTPAKALELLATQLGLEWRVLASGKVWLGVETWPAATPADYAFQADQRSDARALDVAPNRSTLRPGMTVLGQRVSRVTYSITGGGVRASLLYGASEREELAAAIAGLLPPPELSQTCGATVVVQHDDGSIDVTADDKRLPALRRIPFRPGLVGARVVLTAGHRVRVAFEKGSPSGAYATESDSDPAADKGIARAGDPVDCGWVKIVSGAIVSASSGDAGAFHIVGTIPSGSSKVFLR